MYRFLQTAIPLFRTSKKQKGDDQIQIVPSRDRNESDYMT